MKMQQLVSACSDKTAARKSGSRVMKLRGVRLVLPTALLVIAISTSGRAEQTGRADLSKQALQAKVEYCKTCHGVSAQGFRGFFPIPRLAGQQTRYLENQLQAFIERRRENKFMYVVSHVLSPAMRTALAAQFKDLDPKPLGGAPKGLVAAGKDIYENGDPESNVPACMACHGPEAKGQAEIPRLAGQLNDYIFNKLVNWSKERGQDPAHPDTSAIMLPTSHNLSKSQIQAVAAYVSYIE
jgi:cytochrome c553